MAEHGKRHREVSDTVDRDRSYQPAEAIDLAKQSAVAKFDESIELHINTSADPRHADQQIRTVATLPNGTGKTIRVLAFVQGESVLVARDAGVDFIGDEDTIESIEKNGWTDFDVSIATPDMMGKVGRLGKILGSRGLMPNPRTGTVVQPQDVGRVIREAKQGRMEFRMDRSANIHMAIGKLSFTADELLLNLTAFMDAVTSSRPDAVKGNMYKSIYLTSTMGPGIALKLAETQALRLE